MAHKVKAVIFDQDGLMFDTERLSVEAWNIVGKRFGISVGDEFFDGIRGSKPDTVKRLLNEMFGPEFDTDRFLEEKRAFSYDQIRKYGVPVKKGLKELLTYLKEKGNQNGGCHLQRTAVDGAECGRRRYRRLF